MLNEKTKVNKSKNTEGRKQMFAFNYISEMTLAVEGARGPPGIEMTTFFNALYKPL